MSILAKNIKAIRKELGCTQSVMANILKVGFRTFVRYEVGERDAPIAVLVKIARLGNISLEKLLTKAIEPNDVIQTVPELRSKHFLNFAHRIWCMILLNQADRFLLCLSHTRVGRHH